MYTYAHNSQPFSAINPVKIISTLSLEFHSRLIQIFIVIQQKRAHLNTVLSFPNIHAMTKPISIVFWLKRFLSIFYIIFLQSNPLCYKSLIQCTTIQSKKQTLLLFLAKRIMKENTFLLVRLSWNETYHMPNSLTTINCFRLDHTKHLLDYLVLHIK